MDTAIREGTVLAITHTPLVLRLRPVLDLSEDQLFALCQLNRDLQIERNAERDLLLRSPTGGETSEREAGITAQLWLWAKRDGTGATYSPTGGFRLPNGAMRSPDTSWVLRSRLASLSAEERRKFIPLCPDFVLELRSPTDSLRVVQAKVEEYLANGARLGWLLDPEWRHVYVYRPDAPVERLDQPDSIKGDPVLPGSVLDLREVW